MRRGGYDPRHPIGVRPRDDRPALGQTLTCETRGDTRHCFDHHGHLSTEERSGDYVHGGESQGRAWTTWERDERTTTWPTR
jgi:hypothetical protein